MNREALQLYLQNIRDLEVARYFLNQKYQRERENHQRQIDNLRYTSYQFMPQEPETMGPIIGAIFSGICAVILFVLAMLIFRSPASSTYAGAVSGAAQMFAWLLFLAFIAMGIVTIVLIYKAKETRDSYKKQCEDIAFHNECEKKKEEKNKSKISSLNRVWNQTASEYQEEINKIEPILNDFYSMNIIPKRFRNVSAMCYIYEYMSTSQESLSMALLDQHLEDGIQRIENKLNTIISDLTDLIYETRCLRQDSQQIIEQNKKNIDQNNRMLESLQRTEQNTLQAAQYAQLSADYSKANAYFSLATYLKK